MGELACLFGQLTPVKYPSLSPIAHSKCSLLVPVSTLMIILLHWCVGLDLALFPVTHILNCCSCNFDSVVIQERSASVQICLLHFYFFFFYRNAKNSFGEEAGWKSLAILKIFSNNKQQKQNLYLIISQIRARRCTILSKQYPHRIQQKVKSTNIFIPLGAIQTSVLSSTHSPFLKVITMINKAAASSKTKLSIKSKWA